MGNINDNELGGQLRPVHNNIELKTAIIGRRNCCIYTVGTFQINEQNYYELKSRNIKLVGLAFAQLKYKPLTEKQQERTPLSIIIDELSKLSLNISTNVKSEQKNKYINGGMQ